MRLALDYALPERGFRSDSKGLSSDEPGGSAHKPDPPSQRKFCSAALAFLIISDENTRK